MRDGWIALAIAIAACNGSSDKASTSAPATAPTPAPPPPKVALVRCAPAPALPYDRQIGILGSSALQQGGAFASLTGTGDIGDGFDDPNVTGGLLGSGTDVGGGFGRGGGWGIGAKHDKLRGAKGGLPSAHLGQPTSVGDLDKAIIRRYIKRNLSKIEYCYEKQLLATPGLEGTVTAQFFIDPNGNVASASAQGMNADVAACVADVIHAIQFPTPKGGGGVQVSYPFTFRDTLVRADPSPAPALTPDPAPVAPDPAAAAAPPADDAWTPFADAAADLPDEIAGPATVAVQGAVQARLGAIDACFGAATGSLRAMIAIDPDGTAHVRAGGLGVIAAERCVAKALASMRVTLAAHEYVEVACDLARGPEQPWRVSPDDFDAIDVAHGAPPRAPSGDRDLLVVVAPDATGAELRAAAQHVPDARAIVYALRDGGAAPLYLGANANGGVPARAPSRPRLELIFHADRVELCAPGAAGKLEASPRALDPAFATIAAACKGGRCSDAVAVDDRELSDAGALAAALAKARAIGFARVAVGEPLDGCAP